MLEHDIITKINVNNKNIESLKSYSVWEPVIGCEPSTYQPNDHWLIPLCHQGKGDIAAVKYLTCQLQNTGGCLNLILMLISTYG